MAKHCFSGKTKQNLITLNSKVIKLPSIIITILYNTHESIT